MILPVTVILLFLIYSVLIVYFWISWKSIPLESIIDGNESVKFSIIIPARNEEKNIAALLQALQLQSYPASMFEVIVIDDCSDDRTVEIVKHYPCKLIRMGAEQINSHKKKAIELGIAEAEGDYIITTDADCIPPTGWIKSISQKLHQTNAVFIAAPVSIECNSSIVQLFQSMDFMILQGITGAAVSKQLLSMCNGANITYKREAFEEVKGFEGIDKIASGDDMLLMHKIWKRYPCGITYLKSKEAIVTTAPVITWKAFFNQRIRWASKALMYEDKRITIVLAIVYLFNLSFLSLFIAGFINWNYWIWFLALWIAKTFVEIPFFYSLATFFDKQWAVKYFFFVQPLHISYTIISGFLGQFGKYEWKGRSVR